MMNRDQPLGPKPYDFVSFPSTGPTLSAPIGHDSYKPDRLHGALYIQLQVQTALHVSTGITGLGSDVGSRLPLIKTMTTTLDKQLVVQGSSLKGCVRAVYEAITNSTLAVPGREKQSVPANRLPCRDKTKLCPASRVFGAMDWQGLVSFSDAKCLTTQPGVGFMPSLYSPRPQAPGYYDDRGKVAGRKFYFNMTKAVDKGENRGIPVQQAGRQYVFETIIHYKNLLPEELGILLLIFGQDKKSPIARSLPQLQRR
jgi:RAMP superfamily